MKQILGVLFSGGKDSNYVTYLAQKASNTISCLITLSSKNPNSYMFQSVGNNIIDFQAKAMNIPLLRYETKGEKEKELEDLKSALKLAKEKYNITGVCSGAIKSAYQASRIQKICLELDLFCYNPIWQIDEDEYMNKLLENKFKISIFGIFSYPFEKPMLGKIISQTELNKLKQLRADFQISIAGEGGEYESFILDAPMYKQKLQLLNFKTEMDSENSGIITDCEVELVEKEENKNE
jgi:asparagine synthase (glutamine-hydrolysing)